MGNALLLVPSLALLSVLAWITAIHVAHYFMVIAVSTAGGADQVEWPDEPLFDWFWKVFYLGYIGGICLIPPLLIGRISGDMIIAVSVAAVVFGLCFPIVFLSSMVGPSKWLILFPPLFPRLGQRTTQLMGFYLWSMLPIVVGALSILGLLGLGSSALIIPSAIVFTAMWFIYARLLGRLAFVLSFTKGPKKAKRRRERPNRERRTRPARAEATDPWATPDDEEEPAVTRPSQATPHHNLYGEVVGYDLSESPAPPPPPPASTYIPDEDDEAIPLADEELPDLPPTATVEDRPRHRRRVEDLPPVEHLPEPKQPWNSRMITFLFQPDPMMAWIRMSIVLMLIAGLWQWILSLWPN